MNLDYGDFADEFGRPAITPNLLAEIIPNGGNRVRFYACLLYTSDAADE